MFNLLFGQNHICTSFIPIFILIFTLKDTKKFIFRYMRQILTHNLLLACLNFIISLLYTLLRLIGSKNKEDSEALKVYFVKCFLFRMFSPNLPNLLAMLLNSRFLYILRTRDSSSGHN